MISSFHALNIYYIQIIQYKYNNKIINNHSFRLTKPDFKDRPIPNRPADDLLAYLLHNYPNRVYKFHEHDSLLERKTEQDLSEEEKANAWATYENDVKTKSECIIILSEYLLLELMMR